MSHVIATERLDLVPGTAEILEALFASDTPRASTLLGYRFPPGWPGDPEAHQGLAWHARALRRNPADALWRVRFIVIRDDAEVAGSINLKGAPTGDRTCEIGWGVAHARRRRGIALEASRAVIDWAFATGAVDKVIATVPEGNHASAALATRLRMHRLSGEKRDGRSIWCVTVSHW